MLYNTKEFYIYVCIFSITFSNSFLWGTERRVDTICATMAAP